ncbi:adenylate kinase-like [Oscarella lobularis]|uniref:adenylate kinase-like n=1 Tax=Oscarella lobularis TaxID=121494 RepID=UPI003313E6CA
MLDGLPCKCDDWGSIDEQLAFVQDLRVKPDFVINLGIPDGDLMGRRLGVLVDPETNTSYGKDSHSSADEKRDDDASDVDGSEEISDEDDKEDDDVDAENLRSINKETIENNPLPVEMLPESVIGRLVKQPTEMTASIKEATQLYKDKDRDACH